MLAIRRNGGWEEVDPRGLVQMMLDGTVDRMTCARDSTRSSGEEPLERLLDQPHTEELSTRILEQLGALYDPGSAGSEPARLLARLGDLCRWDWPDPVIRARLLWVAAWVAELAGSFEKALSYYGAFFRQRSPETRLRLLAYNNRGVLRVRLGQVQGVRDLARAAIMLDSGRAPDQQPAPLPAAAFSLLNLLNVAAQSDILRDEIEPVLVNFFVRLPESVRARWIGRDPRLRAEDTDQAWGSMARVTSGAGEEAAGQSAAGGTRSAPEGESATTARTAVVSEEEDVVLTEAARKAELRRSLRILKDGTFWRLNRLSPRLAAEAQGIWPDSGPPPGKGLSAWAMARLRLWLPRTAADVAGETGEPGRAPVSHAEYAEAASLLYARHIPTSFQPHDRGAISPNGLAEEGLARAERYLEVGQCERAVRTLEGVAQALQGTTGDASVSRLVRRIGQLMKVAKGRLERQKRLQLHQTCISLRRQVDDMCQLDDLYALQRAERDFGRRLALLQQGLNKEWGQGFGRIVGDLRTAVEEHVKELELRDVRTRLEEPRRRLQETWPRGPAYPVRAEAYAAVRQCRAIDRMGTVDDWAARKTELDQHQGHYYFERVLRAIAGGRVETAQVEGDLGRALFFDPTLVSAATPIVALLHLPVATSWPEHLEGLWADSLKIAEELLRVQPWCGEGTWNPQARKELIQEACQILQRLFRAFLGVAGKMDDLWKPLEAGLDRALEEGRPDVLDEIEQMLAPCLPACPDVAGGLAERGDPRNRLSILLLEKCPAAKELGLGERKLNAERPAEPEQAAGLLDESETHFTKALELGLERRGHVRRAVRGLYLTRFGRADARKLQRSMLDRLEAWVAELDSTALGRVCLDTVARQAEEVRRQLAEPPPVGVDGDAASHPPNEDVPPSVPEDSRNVNDAGPEPRP